MRNRAAGTFALAALALVASALVGCPDLDPSPPPACTPTPPATLAKTAAAIVPSPVRGPVRPIAIADPDPLSTAPFSRDLDAEISCAKPVAAARKLPSGASPLVKRLYDGCAKVLKSPGEQADPVALGQCVQLASILDAGYGAPENALLAVNIDARACGLGSGSACESLATAAFEGRGLPFDPACGEAVLAWGCNRDDGDSCAKLGQRKLDGDLVAEDVSGGRALLEKACDKGSFHGCLGLAKLTHDEAAPARTALIERAATLAEKACQDGDAAACYALYWAYRGDSHGSDFGDAFSKAHDDPGKATAFKDKACGAQLPYICYGGNDRGDELKKDCDAGNAERCIDLVFAGPFGSGNPLRPEDKKHLEEACRGGSSRGCWALGNNAPDVLHAACLEGVPTACRPDRWDVAEAAHTDADRKVFCEQGSAVDCRELGQHVAKTDPAQALKLFERACPSVRSRRDFRDIDAVACAEAGRRYRKGEGVAADPVRALDLLMVGCNAEGRLNPRGTGCAELAEMFDRGEGTPKDRERATSIYAGLCAAQSSQCDAAKARLGSIPERAW